MAHLVHPSTVNTATIVLSLFMVLFMLFSAVIQQRLYLGQVPLALVIGVIFGPESAGFFNPLRWANAKQVMLEFTRIILAIQCFGNAIELPKRYIPKQWVSLAWIIGPVMLLGWLVSTCCAKLMIPSFSWRQAFACAACFNAIDPVLAQTILSGRFAKRIPAHLRHLLRAESAANGVTTTLVLNLTKYLLQYPDSPRTVVKRFFSMAVSYEVAFGTFAGVLIGYASRRALRGAYIRDYVDRQSFLAHYLSVALFSLGFGTVLGLDEVNSCFFAGVGLDNDNWYEEKTEESFFSSCVDLVLNLSYFVFVGALVPWRSFNSENLGIVPWRLVVGTISLFVFRRIPAVLLFKPIVPNIKTWREALFYGHFGPIGAGALFSALLLHGSLDSPHQTTFEVVSETHRYHQQLWIVAMFVFVCSSIVHGSSIALFTLGRHVNTWTLTMEYVASVESESSGPSREIATARDRLSRIRKIANLDYHELEDLDVLADRLRRIQSLSNSDSVQPQIEASPYVSEARMNTAPVISPSIAAIDKTRLRNEINETFEPSVDQNENGRRLAVTVYQYGSTVIVEDADGEVVTTYDATRPDVTRDGASQSLQRSVEGWLQASEHNESERCGDESLHLVPSIQVSPCSGSEEEHAAVETHEKEPRSGSSSSDATSQKTGSEAMIHGSNPKASHKRVRFAV